MILCDDAITTILAMLPVKSIHRFRSVSKTWLSLFSNPYFIKLHCNYAVQQNKFSLLIKQSDKLCSIGYDSLASNKPLNLIDYPFISFKPKLHFVGSCNGLVAFTCHHRIHLWNPSTNEYSVLPAPPSPQKPKLRSVGVSCGFGYDCKLDDYKFICIGSVSDGDDFYSQVVLYRLGSWKFMKNIPYKILGGTNGVFLNGALHWIATPAVGGRWTKVSCNVILSFDMVDERFREVPLHEKLNTKTLSPLIHLNVLGECLCVFDNIREVHTEVWVMKEHDYWIKLFTITRDYVIKSITYMNPVKCLNNGDVLMICSGWKDLVLYDPKQKKCTISKLSDMPICFDLVASVGTLVSLNSGTYFNLDPEFVKDICGE